MTRAELITAVLADPDMAWAVLTAEIKVAGPWETVPLRGGPIRRRRSPTTQVVSCYERGGNVFTTQAGGPIEWPKPFPGSLAEAEAWLDAHLKANGWLLASETP